MNEGRKTYITMPYIATLTCHNLVTYDPMSLILSIQLVHGIMIYQNDI
jgi:hypothetical protein